MTELEDLQSQIDTLESMLAHARNTIARLEGRWRAPGAAKRSRVGWIVTKHGLMHSVASCIEDGGRWMISGVEHHILAWCELPPIPSDEMYAGLE